MNTIKKAHVHLTLLNGCITTLILIVMTLGCLFISESNMLKNKMYSYQSDIYTIASYIEQQEIISNTWLSQLESGKKYYVSLMDNGTEFLYDTNKILESGERKQVLDKAWRYYRDENSPMTHYTLSYKSSYASFILNGKNDSSVSPFGYCCFVIHMEKNASTLEILLAAPLETIQKQITRQRLLFLGIITLALIAIWIFAWIFTGKLLNPIEAGRLRQNQFIASASHELRTPLAVILSCAEAGLDRDTCSELSTIKNEALRTSRLLNDMLTLLSCDTGHLDIKPATTQLDTLVLNACEAFESMAAAKHIRISASLPEEPLPDCICDSERIVQVLTIFLHNAVSYTPENGKICLSITYMGKYFEIKISDTGVGISDEEKIKIFDRFYRSEKARSDKNHFGLGLSIAYDIITAHHGNIKVTDTPGGGTTFLITLRSLSAS
ncbi:MAG: HAMP domain-containing histidine kinase [Lachnospiraceae bacterium]|nr:HAMP domain-containing histidine kinase [Lachnospiraceae bacterium]